MREVTDPTQCKCPDLNATTVAPLSVGARNGHSQCVVCGSLNPRSLQVSFEKTADEAVVAIFKVRPEFQGYDNQLHGGITATLMDAAMTHCLFHHGISAVTADLRVRFLYPVYCNTTVDLRAWLFFSCPPLYHLKAEITRNDMVMARADGKFMRRERQDES